MSQSAAASVQRFRDKALRDYGQIKKEVAFHCYALLILDSPVDTGRFRASWNLALHSPNLSVHPPARILSSSGPRPLRYKTGRRKGRIKHATIPPPPMPTITGRVEGVDIWITNNLPYAIPLNRGHGHMPQVAPGMMQRAVRGAQSYYDILVRRVVGTP